MWLVVICILSFVVGCLSFKATLLKRIWINIGTPVLLTLVIVVLPGLVASDNDELIWRLISIPAALGFGITAAFLSEIPIAIFSKRDRQS
jgi:hypothetical protein